MPVKKLHRRVILCGASSVGKTTLASDWCHRHTEFRHIREIAREVMKRDGITRDDLLDSLKTAGKGVFLNLQYEIIKEQNRQELLLENEPFISDRGPDPVVYVQNLVSNAEADKLITSEATQSCFERYRHLLVVVLSVLDQSMDDGVRLVPNRQEQEEFTNTLKGLLDRNRIPYLYMKETDRKLRLDCLENAIMKGILPLDPALTSNLSVCIPPTPLATGGIMSIPTLEISVDSVKLTSSLLDKGKTNRMIERYGIQQFVLVSFDRRVSSKTVREVLNKGVWLNGNEYHFLGCSSSGLKQRKCYMYKGDILTVEKVLRECGSFESIKSVSKQLKRIGQLFSAAVPTGVVVTGDQVKIEDDIETKGGNFTDGCGAVSENISLKIIQGANIEETDYIPSVFQIRYEGCKGIIVRDTSLAKDTLLIRKSMKKFNPGLKPFNTLWLCDYSKPYSYGHLNKQYILLFSALGIKDEVFLKKQSEYFEKIEKFTSDPEVAIEILGQKKPQMAISIVNCSSNIHKEDIRKELSHLRSKCIEKLEKLRIIVPESRNIFGVCDPLGVLEYGECFVRPTIRGKPQTISGFVTVSKNPCYLLGDVRVLRAVDDDRTTHLHHLVDCIVFPVRGKRPHPSEIAGSDLDGDMYFVCWDKDLIVPRLEEPYDYPSTEAPQSSISVTQSMRIDYISGMNRESQTMGKIDSYFNYWADVKGAGCDECVSLGKLFSRSVDASKTGDVVPIDSRLKPPDDDGQLKGSSAVWKDMLENAKKKKEELQGHVVNEVLFNEVAPIVSESFILELIQQDSTHFSEYQLFQLAHRWCSSQSWSSEEVIEKLLEFSMYINFGKFTVDQKVAAIDAGIPQNMVTNALNKSSLLSNEMLRYFSLNSSIEEWSFYFHSFSFDFNWHHMLRGLGNNDESFIVIRLPDGVTIALHFLERFHLGSTDLNSGSVIAYFFSAHFNLCQRHVLGQHFKLHLTDELLQIYRENDERKTFVWLRAEIETKVPREQSGRASRNVAGHSDPQSECLFDRLSVDLTQFHHDIIRSFHHPKVNKQEFHEMEMFVRKYEPAYFDIYIADQSDVLFPEINSPLVVPEDVPDEDEDLSEEPSTLSLSSLSEELLFQLAEKGDLYSFFGILDGVLTTGNQVECSPKILLSLLTSVNVRYGHSFAKRDPENCLQKILSSLVTCFVEAQDCLDVLKSLCWLNDSSILECTAPMILSNLQLSSYSMYVKLVSDWKCWCTLPTLLAQQVSSNLYTLCQSLLDKEGGMQLEKKSILELALADQSSTVIDINNTQLQQYLLYFMHRILLYFIKDASTQRENKNNTICMMKAIIKDDAEKEPMMKINFHRTDNIYSTEFSVGTYVVVMSQSASFPVALGRITRINRHPPDIEIETDKPVSKCLLNSAKTNKGHWMLRLIGNVTMFRRSINALNKLLNKKEKSTYLLPLLIHPQAFPRTPTSFKELATSNPDPKLDSNSFVLEGLDGSFNCTQKEAIKAALTQRLTLVHGPPGTGKTHVACAIVQQFLLRNPTCKVLVTAETNMAVDNLTRRLLQKNIKVVRVSSNLSLVSPDICHSSLFQQIEQQRLESGRDKSRHLFPEEKVAKKILKHAEVVATTCTGAGDQLLESFTFPFVLIDEATLVIEPVSLIPITLSSHQLVLIGDPQQLAPSIPGRIREDSPEDVQVGELSSTLFHRMKEVLPSYFLDEQHRMHPSLAEFPSEHFYQGRLRSASCLSEREPFKIPWVQEDKPSIFIDVKSTEKRMGTSYCNKTEADLTVKVIKSLLNNEVSPMEITVLTPYVGQVKCIKDELALINDRIKVSSIDRIKVSSIDRIEVSSIDRFQGRENEVIIFNSVRCNENGSLGFFDDPYRMNVLLTRGKKCLIGIGSKDTLHKGSHLWRCWLDTTYSVSKEELEKALLQPKKVTSHSARQQTYSRAQHSTALKKRSCATKKQKETYHRND